jgi:predicted RNA-binding Zn-ribbon protein involved in translation (DUF1610 family)
MRSDPNVPRRRPSGGRAEKIAPNRVFVACPACGAAVPVASGADSAPLRCPACGHVLEEGPDRRR